MTKEESLGDGLTRHLDDEIPKWPKGLDDRYRASASFLAGWKARDKQESK